LFWSPREMRDWNRENIGEDAGKGWEGDTGAKCEFLPFYTLNSNT